MSVEYNVDPDNIAQIKEILEKQLLIKKELIKLDEQVERIAAILEDDLHLVMMPKSDLLELLMCAICVYKLKNDEELLKKYKTLYTEYTTTSIYEEKAEEVLLSLIGVDKFELVVRKNLRDAYLTQNNKNSAELHEMIIAELSDRLESTEND